jgi:hypothetical protein
VAVAVLYLRRRERFDAWVQRRGEQAGGRGREALLWIAGVVGFVLLSQAVVDLAVR